MEPPDDPNQPVGSVTPNQLPPKTLDEIHRGYEQPQQNGLSQGQQAAQTSMILGILSLFVVGVILGPIAISKASKAEHQFQVNATVGRVTGWIGTILGAIQIVLVIIWIVFMAGLMAIPTAVNESTIPAEPLPQNEQIVEPEVEDFVPFPEDETGAEELVPEPSQEAAATGSISIGISTERPGLSMADGVSDPVGFEPDVARYIASELGYSPEQIVWVSAPPANRESMLKYGIVDMVVASYGRTPERSEMVDFTATYFYGGQDLLVPVGSSISSVEDLNGKRLCTTIGASVGYSIQSDFAPEVSLHEVGEIGECLDILGTSADAMAGNNMMLAGLASQEQYEGKFKVLGAIFEEEVFEVGIPEGSTTCEAIDDALFEMVHSGAWSQAIEDNFSEPEFVQREVDDTPISSPDC